VQGVVVNKSFSIVLWTTVSFIGAIIFGVLDWLTGAELNFSLFYFFPIALGAWYAGIQVSVILAFLSAMLWFAADALTGNLYSTHAVAVWNIFIRLFSFLSIALSVSLMKRALAREAKTSAELRKALSEIRVLETFVPICAQCKKIRNQQGDWQQLETYFSEHTQTKFSHGYCPECAKKAMEEAGLLKTKPEH